MAQRAVERQPILDPAETSEPTAPLDPELAMRLTEITGKADDAQVVFLTAQAQAQAAVGAAEGNPEGSEAWVGAQQALSALEAARGPLQAQLTALEELRTVPVNAGEANRHAIDAAAVRLADIGNKQAETVQALTTRLK